MAKCFECDTELTASDAFCPNCGITVPREEERDASLEETIIGRRIEIRSPKPSAAMPSESPESEDERPTHVAVAPPVESETSDAPQTEEEQNHVGDEAKTGEEKEAATLTLELAERAEQTVPEPVQVPVEETEPEAPLPPAVPAPVDAPSVEREEEDESWADDIVYEAEVAEEAIPGFIPPPPIEVATPSQDTLHPPGYVSPFEQDEVPQSYRTPSIGAGYRGVGTTGAGGKSGKLQPLDEGTKLAARYEIVKKIGGGGMGAVYLANDLNLGGAPRAVKEMIQSYIDADQQEKAVNDFKRESLLLTNLEHPSIPTIYDYFFDEASARFYLVMKYIGGGDLAGRLRAAPEGRIEEKTVTEWAIDVAEVLDYLHRHEPAIVYRDLKPANVMLDANGRVMLIDFGIARWLNKEEKGVTAVGTMGYAPPELFSGNVEPRSDIYSLGSTMFHLLTGADPQSNPLLIFDFDKNPKPRQINPQLSDQMEAILMRAVQYNAAARFASASEMRNVLIDHLENLKLGNLTYGPNKPPPIPVPKTGQLDASKVFCGFCGKPIVSTDMFCAFCGSRQTNMEGVTEPKFVDKTGVVKLVILGSGGLDVPAFILEKPFNLVGRRDPGSNIFPEVDLSRYDPTTKISRRHAQISRSGAGFVVEDLGSSNGTFLVRETAEPVRLKKGNPHELLSGDKIRVGDTTLQFVLE